MMEGWGKEEEQEEEEKDVRTVTGSVCRYEHGGRS